MILTLTFVVQHGLYCGLCNKWRPPNHYPSIGAIQNNLKVGKKVQTHHRSCSCQDTLYLEFLSVNGYSYVCTICCNGSSDSLQLHRRSTGTSKHLQLIDGWRDGCDSGTSINDKGDQLGERLDITNANT